MKLHFACAVALSFLGSSSLAAPKPPLPALRPGAAPSVNDLRQILKDTQTMSVVERQNYLLAIRFDPRILGGQPFSSAQAPYQVALIRGYAANRYQFCGGTLVAPDTVVTAAHCIDNPIVQKDPARLDIVAGTAFYQEAGERIKAKSIVVHPQWNATSQDYDVAIVKLQTAALIGRPIAIDGSEIPVGARATVTGWGALAEGGRGSEELMGVTLPVIDTQICNSSDSYAGAITPRMVCAGEREGGLDSCQGDSGGPLVTGSGTSARLVGVVSWGEGCARALKYGVYARISSVAPWIASFASP